ncbi:MAG: Ig-like domain-containing protein, partial [Gemmatimonadota bacterium]|nr:Ig-like domain-containing protein [Gemmatimonadota bacterium]
GAGFAIIRATIDQKVGQVLVTVMTPVASVQVTARRTTVGISGTLQLTAMTRDANNATLTGRAVTWSSSDETKARVSSAGLVTGVAAGNVTVTATSEAVPGTIAITVADVPPPQISTVSPATLGPGVTATISGANFDANAADLDVTIAGIPVAVTAAAATQLTVQLPAFVPCQPTQNVTVSVTGVGGTATHAHPLQVARQRSVAVGEMLVLNGADARCNELPQTGGRYAIAVVNHSRAPSAGVGFEFRGLVGTSASAAAARTPASAPARSAWGVGAQGPITLGIPAGRTPAEVAATEHMRRLEHDRALVRELVRRYGSPRAAARRTAAVTSASLMDPVPLTVGATASLKIRSTLNQCQTYTNVPARVVHVGSHNVVLEADDAPLKGTMDDDYIRLSKEYDDVMHQTLLNYFGDPIAYDTATDKNQRIVMLFARAVNQFEPGILGFASACDLFPPSIDPRVAASNQAEIFYARVPTSNGADPSNSNTRVGWMRAMRPTLIHEAKHITSFAVRFADPNPAELEESWLEEATAMVAMELYARATYYAGKATWKGNATYQPTVYCDVRPNSSQCGDQPKLMVDHFALLYRYHRGVETKSFVNSPNIDVDVYGSGWSFARWAADQYAADEAAFFKALTSEIRLTGIANIEARTGQSFADLHPNFMMALYADDLPGFTPPAGARFTMPSWNMRDIFAGLSTDFPQVFPQTVPLSVRSVSFGSFTADVGTLLGGGAAYVELSGTPTPPQVLDLRAPGGSALPAESTLRLAILRVQ